MAKKRNWRKGDFAKRYNLPVEEILATLRLEELLDALGLTDYREYHDKLQMQCPLPSHGGIDKNPSFAVLREFLTYNCFVCGSGRITDMVMQLQNVTEEEALMFMMSFSDAASVDEEHTKYMKRLEGYVKREPQKVTMPGREPSLPWYAPHTIDRWHAQAEMVRDYWDMRYISKTTVEEFMLGYDPEYTKGSYVGPAVIVPHFYKGILTGWQARFLDEDLPEWVKKWDNTDDFPKSDTLYNYMRATTTEGPTYVVEAALTAARLHTAGYTAVATFGASITDRQMKLLKRLAQEGLIVSYDADAAGRKTTERLASGLSKYGFVDVIPPNVVEEQAGKPKADLGDLDDSQLARALVYTIPQYAR